MVRTTLEMKAIKKKYFISSFDKLKLNYIVIPKNASTSILYYLLSENGNKPNKQSVSLHSVNTVKFITKDEAISSGYPNFTYLRNPINRALSAYKDFALNRTSLGGGGGSKKFFRDFELVRKEGFYKMFDMVSQFEDKDRGNHFKSQKYFCILDDLILYSIEKDLMLPKLNTTNNDITLSYRDLELIQNIYKEDFDLWATSE